MAHKKETVAHKESAIKHTLMSNGTTEIKGGCYQQLMSFVQRHFNVTIIIVAFLAILFGMNLQPKISVYPVSQYPQHQ